MFDDLSSRINFIYSTKLLLRRIDVGSSVSPISSTMIPISPYSHSPPKRSAPRSEIAHREAGSNEG